MLHHVLTSALVLAGAAAQGGVWNWNRADGQVTRQAPIAGPQPTNATAGLAAKWVSTALVNPAGFTGPNGFIVQYAGSAGNASTLVVTGTKSAPQGFLAPMVAALDANTGALVYDADLSAFAPEVTYSFGAPSTLVTTVSPAVIVTGQGWKWDNGTFAAVVVAVFASNGSVAWQLPVPDAIVADVVAAPTPGIVYVSTGLGALLTVQAASGAVLASTVPLPAASPYDGSGMAQLTLSPDGQQAVVYNGSVAACVNLVDGSIAWKLAGGELGVNTGRGAWDAATDLVLFPTASGVVAIAGSTGTVSYSALYPLRNSSYTGVAAAPANTPYYFVYTTYPDPSGSSSGLPVTYVMVKSTGDFVAMYAWDPDNYASWGNSMVVDASGLTIYVGILGPLVPSGAPLAAAHPAARSLAVDERLPAEQPRHLQGGGSPYTSVLKFDPSSGDFTQMTLTPLPSAMTCGFVSYAPGPAAGQLAAACAGNIGVLQATA